MTAVAVGAGFASTAGSAKAGLIQGLLGGNCGATLPYFLPWGDVSTYYFAPNGGFENGSAGWTLSGGAAVVPQANEPWYLAGFGSNALQIPQGGSASINVCYGVTYPGIRFFASGVDGDATIHVRVISHSLLGVLSVLDGGTFTASEGWQPSPKVSSLFSALAAPLGSKSMTLEFTVENGTAQIDDLFVDPFLSRM
ncbi:MAG TPA: hypothetical protein VFB25_06425 [Gaiellaceae bacterium]|nr:hypothetical protein [Gaiellaceae bacterium]